MTQFQLHVRDWSGCTRCPLHETRNRVCLVRGQLPCDLLFIGEAPGKSEDVLGKPFVGPAGQLFDRIVAQALDGPEIRVIDGKVDYELTWSFTNLVGCVPIDPETGEKTGEPDDVSVKACTPRLQDLVRMANPRLIVCVGKLAKTWLMTPMSRDTIKFHREIRMVDVVHPAAILRAPQAQQGLMRKRAVLTISDAVEEL